MRAPEAGKGPIRIGLVSSEPLRASMAGIGIRYLELARRLPGALAGSTQQPVEVRLLSPADPEEVPETGLPPGSVRRFVPAAEDPQAFEAQLAGLTAVVAQGQLANDVLLGRPDLPVVVDLYDPWLVENLHYASTLGLDPYRNDHATWVLQLSRGDFFLCSSEEQRLFYLGFLTALGRINPPRLAADPDLARLIAPMPFGLPEELPEHRPLLGDPPSGVRRILFGGLYDWYDPWTLLDALEPLAERLPPSRDGRPQRPQVLFIRNPNPGSTPQALFAELEARGRRRGWWRGSAAEAAPDAPVRVLDWIPSARRWDLLREVEVLVSPHRPSLETRLSLRTRYLDALAAGCPVVATEGGTVSRLLAEHGRADRVVPPGDPEALAGALAAVLTRPREREALPGLTAAFSWDRVLEPLVAFCLAPRKDTFAEGFAFRPTTKAPPDSWTFRLERKLRLILSRLGGAS